MIDKMEYLEVGDKKYPMISTINVLEKIQEKYGAIEKWKKLMLGYTKKFDKKGNELDEWVEGAELNLKDMKFFILNCINEGIDIENEILQGKREFLTEKQVGRIMSEVGTVEIMKKITILLGGTSEESEETEKN